MRLFTYTLSSGSISINSGDGVTQISLQANTSSSLDITGNISFKGLSPNAITLDAGQSLTITTPTQSPLDGVVITHVSGSVDILIGF
jgi:hypothetical protein